jgi:hypothetical protein
LNAAGGVELNLNLLVQAFRVVAPETAQRAAFQKYRGAYAWAIMD